MPPQMPSSELEATELEESRDFEANEPEARLLPVSYSGQDFDVEGLVRRLKRGDIVVPNFGVHDDSIETAGFQRNFVWRRPQMDRFIESLLLGLPVPGIVLVQQQDKRYLVLDGQQRLRTLSYFYGGIYQKREFALNNVAEEFRGLTYDKLDPEQQRTLDNTFIQATIVRTDGSVASSESVYQIFERLNSGGTQLTPHEIRVALYAGPFIDFLADLNTIESWRLLYGPYSPRLRDQELVLRILAFYVAPGEYSRPLKKFLNGFTARHRRTDDLNTELLRKRFDDAATLLLRASGREALRAGGGAINAAFTEAVMVGLARRLDGTEEVDTTSIHRVVTALAEDEQMQTATRTATADEDNVRVRLTLASQAFARA